MYLIPINLSEVREEITHICFPQGAGAIKACCTYYRSYLLFAKII